MSTYLYRLAKWCFHNRRTVLAFWLLAAVLAVVLSILSGGKTTNSFTIPGTEAQRTTDLLSKKVPALSGGTTQVVFAAPAGAKVTNAKYKSAIDTSLTAVSRVDKIAGVTNPFAGRTVSKDGRVGLGSVQYTQESGDVTNSTLDKVKAALQPARSAGLQVDYSGSVYPGSMTKVSEIPEIIGLIVAFLILSVTFGAFVAAGLPILVALVGVITTISTITALASVTTIASASTTVALMLGLSCGIDYGLFILSRHRNNVVAGMALDESVGLSAGTAGSSVVFAALTVIVALCGLSVVGIPFLTVMGFAAAGAVALAMTISLTLLPAMLGFAGYKVVKYAPTPLRPGHNQEIAETAAKHPERTFGARWARFVVRRRVPVLITSVLALGVIALPATQIKLGLADGKSYPTNNTARKAYDLTSEHFGVGFNGPLLIAVEGVKTQRDLASVAQSIGRLSDVTTAKPVAVKNGVGVINAVPKSGPNATGTSDLVKQIRHDRKQLVGNHADTLLVGGNTASNIDVSTKLGTALPIFLIVVVGLAFFLLTFAFRTILVPLKSIAGFLLSVAAAFGASVAVFQWGWLSSILGVQKGDTISFLPIIVLAIIFGLSSDYEVFVVSRIKEQFVRNGDAREAVATGTGLAARVVTAAALIMFTIFVSFLLDSDPTVKAVGFGFAMGVFFDAFVVRLTVVPAIMAIANSKLWYHPQWFAEHVPDPDIEGRRLEESRELAAAGAQARPGASETTVTVPASAPPSRTP